MGPFPISVAREDFSTSEPVILFACELRYRTVGGCAIQEPERTFVHLGWSAAIHVFAGWRSSGP